MYTRFSVWRGFITFIKRGIPFLLKALRWPVILSVDRVHSLVRLPYIVYVHICEPNRTIKVLFSLSEWSLDCQLSKLYPASWSAIQYGRRYYHTTKWGSGCSLKKSPQKLYGQLNPNFAKYIRDDTPLELYPMTPSINQDGRYNKI